jgi:hypothetical protein
MLLLLLLLLLLAASSACWSRLGLVLATYHIISLQRLQF